MPTGVTNPDYYGFPVITINSFSGMLGTGNRTGTRGPEGDVDLVESVSYLRGKHSFKFGFEYLDIVFDGTSFSLAQGNVQFLDLAKLSPGLPEQLDDSAGFRRKRIHRTTGPTGMEDSFRTIGA